MQPSADDLESESADLFERDRIRNGYVFVRGSIRRRRWLMGAVFSSIMALSIGALFSLPKTYHVESKLLAQRSQVLAVRGDGPDSVAPTRGAVETIQRRDNLLALVQATDLVRHYHEHRAPIQRVAEWAVGLVGNEPTAQDRIDSMVELLEKRLVVWTSDGTVSITIDWPDAEMACRLIDAAQQNFLEMRYAQEITALAESIAILRGHAESLTADIDGAVAALVTLRDARRAARGDGPQPALIAPGYHLPHPLPRRTAELSPELTQLKVTLEAKQKVIEDLESARRHRLSDLQARLIEQQATFTDNHPTIIDLKQTLSAIASPSPQVVSLRQEAARLQAEYDGKKGDGAPPADAAAPLFVGAIAAATPPQLPGEIVGLDQEMREDRDPATVYASAQLRDAMDKYATLRTQVRSAQIDLETAQAAFKYRYSVLTPAHLPKSPVKPKALLMLVAAFIAASLVSLLVAVIADIRGGRLVERWQVERLLGRPIIGEVDAP